MPTPLIKVLFLVLDLDLGGMQRVVQSLALGLDRTRFHPSVYCLDKCGIFADRLKDVGIETSVLQRRPGKLDFDLLSAPLPSHFS